MCYGLSKYEFIEIDSDHEIVQRSEPKSNNSFRMYIIDDMVPFSIAHHLITSISCNLITRPVGVAHVFPKSTKCLVSAFH